jgi:hypothetical protein
MFNANQLGADMFVRLATAGKIAYTVTDAGGRVRDWNWM